MPWPVCLLGLSVPVRSQDFRRRDGVYRHLTSRVVALAAAGAAIHKRAGQKLFRERRGKPWHVPLPRDR